MREDRPYLSIVVVSRNDDHGGNPLLRTQLCINSLYEQCNRYRLPAELIVVDWNPPAARPGLADVIQWPGDRRFIRTRVITVPPDCHRSLPHSENLPLFQMIGKNIGIRRARGEFVLATNIDILFSDELMEFIAGRNLRQGFSYRADRFDVRNEVLQEPLQNVLLYARDHVIRVNIKLGTFFNTAMEKKGEFFNPFFNALVKINQNRMVLFVLRLSKSILQSTLSILLKILSALTSGISSLQNSISNLSLKFPTTFFKITRGSVFINISHSLCRAVFNGKKILRDAMQKIANRYHICFPHSIKKEDGKIDLFKFFIYRLKISAEFGFPYVHLNGCGDFTLFAKEDWDALGGYYEEPIFSWNVDSLFLIDAYYSGFPEVYLMPPKNTFHVEHSAGSGWTPGKGEQLLFERLEKSGIPYVTWEDSLSYARQWKEAKDKIGYLHSIKRMDYGFLEWDLPEICIE